MSDEPGKTTISLPAARPNGRRERHLRLLLWGVLGGVLLGVMGFGIWSLSRQQPISTSLPVYGLVPDFSLIDQNRRPLRRADLEGKIWIANFIYTNCPDECPLMTAELAQFQSALSGTPELRLVSITVDPVHDTPEILSQYAKRFAADRHGWSFLTGEKSAIYRLAQEGFKLGIADSTERPPSQLRQEKPPNPARKVVNRCTADLRPGAYMSPRIRHGWWDQPFPSLAYADHGRAGRATETLHSTRFVLVDPFSRIRGYYDSQDEAALQRLCQHIQILRQGH